MEIQIIKESARVPVAVLNIKGAIDSSTYQLFQKQADEAIDHGAQYVLVNLADCTFISSAGLRALHNIFNKLRSIHKDVDDEQLRKKMQQGTYKSPYLKVSNLSQAIKDVFELSGFETYIEVFDDHSAALKSF
jgi:anti-anti-sigma factor